MQCEGVEDDSKRKSIKDWEGSIKLKEGGNSNTKKHLMWVMYCPLRYS